MTQVRMQTPKEAYTVDYQQAIDALEAQRKVLWFAEELGVDKDVGDIRTKVTEGERYGIIEGLKLFTKYELELGEEFWGNRVAKMFPRPADIQRMANMFAFTELNCHAPFYSAINKALKIDNDEFYNSWKEDPVLAERVEFIESHLDSDDDLVTLAAFAFMEGAVLFTNFAYFKSFNVNGFNMIPHIVSGIDASAKDENFHSMATAWLFNQLLREKREAGLITPEQEKELKRKIYLIAQAVSDHEELIIGKLFGNGNTRVITKEQLLDFRSDRVNVVLDYLGCEPLVEKEMGEVSGWFYEQLSVYKYADFFATTQIQYVRNWVRHELGFNMDVAKEFMLGR